MRAMWPRTFGLSWPPDIGKKSQRATAQDTRYFRSVIYELVFLRSSFLSVHSSGCESHEGAVV